MSAQDIEVADNLVIQIATLGKGDPLYVWFGHAGLVVTDLRNDRKVMYDYGIFSFSTGFYRSFAMGRMLYEVWATGAEARYRQAIEEDRDIRTITLNLEPSAKLELVKFLNFNIQSGNHQYLYHHYYENCSTRIRDIIDKAVGGQLKSWATSQPSPYTIRQDVARHTSPSPLIAWLIDFLQSGVIDKEATLWERMFLPLVLEEALVNFTYVDSTGNTVALVSDRQVIHTQSAADVRPPIAGAYHSDIGLWAVASLALAIVLATTNWMSIHLHASALRRFMRVVHGLLNWVWTFIMGVAGTLLLFMMVATSHDVTYGNENIVFANPLLLVMSFHALRIIFGSKKSMGAFRKLNGFMAVVTLVLLSLKFLLPEVLFQDNYRIIITLLPLYIANSRLLALLNKRRRDRKHKLAITGHDPSDLADL